MMTFLLGTMAKENILKITARDDKEAVKRFLKGHKGKRPKREFDIVLQHDLDFKRNIKEVVLDLPFTEKTTKFVMSPTSGNLPDNYFVGSDEEGQQAQFTFDLRDNDSLKITGTIQLDDETTYLISTCQDGSHWIKIIVPGDVPPEEEVEQHQVNELVDNPHDNIIPVLEKDEERTVVDVLIVYTANAMVRNPHALILTRFCSHTFGSSYSAQPLARVVPVTIKSIKYLLKTLPMKLLITTIWL